MPAHLAEAQDLVDDDLNRGRVGPEQRALGLELLQVQQRLSGAASAVLRQSCRWGNVSFVIYHPPISSFAYHHFRYIENELNISAHLVR